MSEKQKEALNGKLSRTFLILMKKVEGEKSEK